MKILQNLADKLELSYKGKPLNVKETLRTIRYYSALGSTLIHGFGGTIHPDHRVTPTEHIVKYETFERKAGISTIYFRNQDDKIIAIKGDQATHSPLYGMQGNTQLLEDNYLHANHAPIKGDTLVLSDNHVNQYNNEIYK